MQEEVPTCNLSEMFSLGFAVNITAELNGNMYDLIWDRLKKDVLEVNYHLNL